MDRLIDEIQLEIRDKVSLSKISLIILRKDAMEELLNDFKEEFLNEYLELGRNPTNEDLSEYLNVPIIIGNVEGKKYSLFAKV